MNNNFYDRSRSLSPRPSGRTGECVPRSRSGHSRDLSNSRGRSQGIQSNALVRVSSGQVDRHGKWNQTLQLTEVYFGNPTAYDTEPYANYREKDSTDEDEPAIKWGSTVPETWVEGETFVELDSQDNEWQAVLNRIYPTTVQPASCIGVSKVSLTPLTHD